MPKFDFGGWATRNDVTCSDGRTIRRDAFADDNGKTVPLVWQHQHDSPVNVLGHALLENRKDGVYAYCTFNNTELGQTAKELVHNGDVTSLSIYANRLKQKSGNVVHGIIREVSLVLAGANPKAYIDAPILEHGEKDMEEGCFYMFGDLDKEVLEHADKKKEDEELEDELADEEEAEDESEDEKVDEEDEESKAEADEDAADEEEEKSKKKKGEKTMAKEAIRHADEETIGDVFDSLSDKQKQVVYYLIGDAVQKAKNGETNDEGDEEMKHNVFDAEDAREENYLSHADIEAIFEDAKRGGGRSLKDTFLAHAEDYGIDGIEMLFPDYKELNNTPEFVKRDDSWVKKVMGGVHHSPFAHVKTRFADITEDEARAKGYIKGDFKKNEVFSLLQRKTDPQTIYKKQQLDRDDIIDITDFDVVAWMRGEMRMMLEEEIARAILIGDGRATSDREHIKHDNVRPIVMDDDFFTIKATVTTDANTSKQRGFINTAIKSRKNYKGSGNPTLFCSEDTLDDLLLMTDQIGRDLFTSVEQLATKLRVKEIVTVPQLENYSVDGHALMGIIVNLNDYNVGADKGGEINMFDDFDIDFNQQKYLIETRISGALVLPFSAIAIFDGTAPTMGNNSIEYSKTTYVAGTPTSNPKAEGFYEKNAQTNKYFPTQDETVDDEKTYYVRHPYQR